VELELIINAISCPDCSTPAVDTLRDDYDHLIRIYHDPTCPRDDGVRPAPYDSSRVERWISVDRWEALRAQSERDRRVS
jgi:hypothetical protein